MSIRLKLTIILVGLVCIPLVFVSMVAFANYRHSLEESRIQQLQELARFKAERIETYFAGLRTSMEMAQSFYNVRIHLPVLAGARGGSGSQEVADARRALDGQLVHMQKALGLADIMLADSRGAIVYASNLEHNHGAPSATLRSALQAPVMGGGDTVLFSSVFMEEATGNRPEMLVTTAARASNGEAIGTIVFVVDMGPLYTLIQDTAGLGSTGEVLVGTRSGNDVVYLNPLRHDPGAALKRRIHIGEAVGLPIQSGVAGQTGVGQSIDYRGQKVIAAWRYLPSLGWGLVAKIDSREEFAVVTRLQHLLIMILAITLIVAGVIIFSITQSIAAPIQALSRGVERVGSGNLDYKVGNTLKDEIGQLSRSFDKMTHDLKAITASRDDLNHEIVEREQAEASLRTTAEDLKRSNSDLEQFAYVASHDLQEPLRAVAGFMGLLKKQYAAALDAPAREYIELAVEGAERMQTLIHDLLTYSRVGTKGGAFVPMRMQDALDAALSNLTLAIDESKASITGDSLPGVQADLSQMTQLLQNLVGNAIKFSGGRRPEVHISAEHRDGHWLVSVRDNGIGIEPQYFERIFLIFQRLHSRSQYQGTGIGLAVCKRIVERHGGAIWVESTPDHGATFSFTIPDRGAYQ